MPATTMEVGALFGKGRAVPFTNGFDPLVLADKFQRHGADFKALTMTEYEQMADEFLGGPRAPTTRECIRRRGGDKLRFDIASDEFGILSPSGEIKNYYKPDPAIHREVSNLVYFLKRCQQ